MNILATWRDSLLVFSRRNATTFWGAVLSKLGQMYKQLFSSLFWWFIPIVSLYAGLMHESIANKTMFSGELLNIGLYVLLFFCLVVAWPSVDRKDSRYYISSLLYFLPFYLGLLVLRFAFEALGGQGLSVIGTEELSILQKPALFWVADVLTLSAPLYIAPLVSFFGFFYLDSENINGTGTSLTYWLLKMPVRVIKSLYRAIKLLVATLPLCIILFFVFKYSVAWCYQVLSLRAYAIEWFGAVALDVAGYSDAWALISGVLARAIDMLCAIVFWPIAIATYAVIYIKWVHERFTLFFSQT